MNNKDKFLEWVSSNISYCDSLNENELKNLRELYDNVEKLMDIESNTLNMALNNKGGIDYSNSFEKASERRMLAQQKLKAYINNLNNIYGVNVEVANQIKK